MPNQSKTRTSWVVGGKGMSVHVRGDKVTGNAEIPGTGISYRERLDDASTEASADKSVGCTPIRIECRKPGSEGSNAVNQ